MHPQDKSGGEIRTPSSPEKVPLILPDDQRKALREDCLSALQGVLDDLAMPDRLRDPAYTAREGRGLPPPVGSARLRGDPDPRPGDARAHRPPLRQLRRPGGDEERREGDRHPRGHRTLLRVLDGSVEEDEDEDDEDEDEESPSSAGPGWLPGNEVDCQREVLDLLLKEAPGRLVFDDLVLALAGHPSSWAEKDMLEVATRSLARSGLIRFQGILFEPTRAARQMADLGFAIG